MRAIRLTLILAGSFLVVALGLGFLLFRSSEEPTQTNSTNGNQVNTANTNGNANTNSVLPEVLPPPATIDLADIRVASLVFAERFESYYENERESVLPSVETFLTQANVKRLEQDAQRLRNARDQDDAKVHTAHAVSVHILSQNDDRASVDVLLFIEISGGSPFLVEETQQKTVRLLLVKEQDEWKIENAAF